MKEILLSKQGKNRGKYCAKVDDADYEWLNQWDWHMEKSRQTYYAIRKILINGKSRCIKMHRVILGLEYGDKREGDHKNHNGLDNQRSNLRISEGAQNKMNRSSVNGATSKYLGVCIYTTNGVYKNKLGIVKTYQYPPKWRAKAGNIFIGYFKTEEEAARAYDKKAKELYGEWANLNFKV